ncbi:MAG: hypothetical protein E7632_01250 [Ruminococcaceae bacterium]|nr:hypothetical protein [Oscillospiraceae bacterium]
MTDRFLDAVRLERAGLTADALGPDDRYLLALPVTRHLKRLTFDADVTFFAGENGTGKSTLIEAIAVRCGFNAEGGSRNFNFTTRKSHSALCAFLEIEPGRKKLRDGYFLRAESFYNVATNIEELDRLPAPGRKIIDSYGGRSLHEMSHGESFFTLMLNRFGGNGLYILDEPEAALSPSRTMAMLTLMRELCRRGAQFIISTHSPILLAYPDACIYELSEDGIRRTAYRDTGSYQTMKQFLDNPERMAKYLTE